VDASTENLIARVDIPCDESACRIRACSATIACGAPMAFLTGLTWPRTLLPIDFYVGMSRSGENYRARAGYDSFEMDEREDGQN
jgi:hypothetical protein